MYPLRFSSYTHDLNVPDICAGLFTIWTWSVKLPESLFSDSFKRSYLSPLLYRWNLLLVTIALTKNIFLLPRTVFYKLKACFLKLKIDTPLASIFCKIATLF